MIIEDNNYWEQLMKEQRLLDELGVPDDADEIEANLLAASELTDKESSAMLRSAFNRAIKKFESEARTAPARHAGAEFALAADDGHVRNATKVAEFFLLGPLTIDGIAYELLTDGNRVAVQLNANEQRTGVWIDDTFIPLQDPLYHSLAVLTDFGIADAEELLRQVQKEADKHVLRWA